MDRAVRNCGWSGDLWSFNIRFQAQMKDVAFSKLWSYKERAVVQPWLTAQPTELAKVIFAWIAICRLFTEDLYEGIEDITSLEDELEDCLERIGNGNSTLEKFLKSV